MESININQQEAIRLMNEAVEMENSTAKHPVTPGEVLPAVELLGDLYMELGRPQDALRAYEQDLVQHPNRFNGIFGAAMAASKIQNHEKAIQYFQLLVEQVKGVNSDRVEVAKAALNIQTQAIIK